MARDEFEMSTPVSSKTLLKKAVVKETPELSDMKKYPFVVNAPKRIDGASSDLVFSNIVWAANHPLISAGTFIQLNLSHGGLNCCGMGTIGGFTPYFPHAETKKLVIPSADVIQKFILGVMDYLYAENLGIMNHGQFTSYGEFWSLLFSYEVVHETTNKNHGGVLPMRVIKISRQATRDMWTTPEVGPANYRAYMEKRYPTLKGQL